MKIGYPSRDFPGPTPFFLTIPEDWKGIHVPGALLAVAGPEPDDGVRSNIVVTWRRIGCDESIERYANKLETEWETNHPDVELIRSEVEDVEGLPCIIFQANFRSGEANVEQMSALILGPETSPIVRDLLQITATYNERSEAEAEMVRVIVETFFLLDMNGVPDDLEPVALLEADESEGPTNEEIAELLTELVGETAELPDADDDRRAEQIWLTEGDDHPERIGRPDEDMQQGYDFEQETDLDLSFVARSETPRQEAIVTSEPDLQFSIDGGGIEGEHDHPGDVPLAAGPELSFAPDVTTASPATQEPQDQPPGTRATPATERQQTPNPEGT